MDEFLHGKSYIDPVFNMFKVRFDWMNRNRILRNDVDRINWYINLENVFRVLLSPRLENMLMAAGIDDNQIKMDLISNMVNLGQHYRLYAAKMGYESRVILYWNYTKGHYNNRKYLVTYRKNFENRLHKNIHCERLTRCLAEAIEFIQKLFGYINQVYLIDGGEIESSLIPHLVETDIYQKDGIESQIIIVSHAKYDFQYIQYGYTILSPKGDNSSLISNENVIDHMKVRSNIKNPLTIPPEQLSFALALLGDEHRGIPSTEGVGLSTVVKSIRAAIDNLAITPTTQDIEMLSTILGSRYKSHVETNYRCTNFSYQMREVTPIQKEYITSQFIDKYDENTLKSLNEKFFQACPLMLVQPRSEQVRNDYRTERSIFS